MNDQEFRLIDIDLLDAPLDPARETFDEVKLNELVTSIRDIGLIEPLVVRPKNGRFEIVAGHRRWCAAAVAGLTPIPCLIRGEDGVSDAAIKIHENVMREDLNPGEMAVWFARALESDCGGDVDRLVEMVKRPREYVESRLLLLSGDPEILAAVKDNKLSFAVGRELNRVSDQGYRRSYLDAAIRGGASARMVRDWRIQAERLIKALPAEEPGPDLSSSPPAKEMPGSSLICFLCEDSDPIYELELLYVHTGCRKIFLDRIIRSIRTEAREISGGKGVESKAQPSDQGADQAQPDRA